MSRISVHRGSSSREDEAEAIAELAGQTGSDGLAAVILFCSPRYDLQRLGQAIARHYTCPVIACTTAGEVTSGRGYQNDAIVGVGLSSPELVAHTRLIAPLDKFDAEQSIHFADKLQGELTMAEQFDPAKMFGFMLIDGLSMLEEQVTASLFSSLKGVSLIGGSAGDELRFENTWVYHDGEFHSNAALFTLFETTLPFKTFRIQHFIPSEDRLVITEADGAKRIVYEINGEPAAEEYARTLGLQVDELTSQVFAAYPVMLRINGEYFVRSIQKVNEDGSLTFFCAIDNGLVLTVARGSNLLDNLQQNLRQLKEDMPQMQLILGCDCILRRLELHQKGLLDQAAPVLDEVNFVGFSTYGEQFNGIHVNQTLTGLALGG